MAWEVMEGDCRVVMELFMDESSVDAIVTDPPYGLEFMGKAWDRGVPGVEFWRHALRVLKPGGYLIAFSGSRTYHRMVCAIEDAGFEIRDQIMWLYGSGFPKSHNLDGEHKGKGTALKPAHEPIVVARKPLIGTVAANVLAHGTGALNIDACRVEGVVPSTVQGQSSRQGEVYGADQRDGDYASALGRWPANVIHDGSDEVLAAFPNAPGQLADAKSDGSAQGNHVYGAMKHTRTAAAARGDSGSAARFFYCAKASKADRSEGVTSVTSVTAGVGALRDGGRVSAPRANHHPTVKPTALMRYLCKLVTPSGGTVLDPFTGSGSTGKAAVLEGFSFIGIEQSHDYVAIAEARLRAAEHAKTSK